MANSIEIVDWDKSFCVRNNVDKHRMEIWQEKKLKCYAHHGILKGKRPEQLVDSKAYDVLQVGYDNIYKHLGLNGE